MGRPAGPKTETGKSAARVERARKQARTGGKFASGTVEREPERTPAPPPPAPVAEPDRVEYPPRGNAAPAPNDEPPAPLESSPPSPSPAPAPTDSAPPAPSDPPPAASDIPPPAAAPRPGFLAGVGAATARGVRG